jgi:hypothetical protein
VVVGVGEFFENLFGNIDHVVVIQAVADAVVSTLLSLLEILGFGMFDVLNKL